MPTSECKICRRSGAKLFLKGDRCFSQKCAMIKRPYVPGPKKKRRFSSVSEYAKELKEKQKLKNWYNLSEKQFSNYVKKILAKKGGVENASVLLIQNLESRLDNVVFRLGFALSRSQAKQLVSHGHFLVNGKPTDVPSYRLKKGDVVSIKPTKTKKSIFQNVKNLLKKTKVPVWLHLDVEKAEGKIINDPTLEESETPVEVSAIFEFYSR